MRLTKKIIAAVVALVTSITALPVFAKPYESTIMKRLPIEVTDTGGTLIFSDSPEYVTKNGILYTDVVKGDARILFYHLNNTGVKKKLAVIVENVSGENNLIEITRGGFSAPNDNFLLVGKETQLMYMQKNFHDKIKLVPNQLKLFQAKMNDVVINPGHLVYGVYDFHAKGEVRVYVLMYPERANPLKFLKYADILPKDEYRLRGTFKNMNRNIKLKKDYDPKRDGIGYILICDDVVDFYKRGIDATDGSEVVNFGNYGINYTLTFNTKSKTKFCLSPLGGTYAGAVRFYQGKKFGAVETPQGRIYFGDKTLPEPESVKKAREEGVSLWTTQTEASELGTFSGNIIFEYSPPGASNLPVNFVLIPDN
ncbi:MAG: copper amine oxidase [Selenomonadaceae bacterium]|nr:copper amine oxidase [Selenomonadaceae bacterium]